MTLEWQEDARTPVPEGHVVLRPLLVGVCGTDLEMVRHSSARLTLPSVLGHEWVAEVVADPRGELDVGAVVVGSNQTIVDGISVEHGFELDGALQTRFTLPPDNVLLAPAGVPLHDLVLVEPAAVVAHGLARMPTEVEQVMVVGDGPIGLMSALAMQAKGAAVTLVGLSESRLAHAERLGLSTMPAADAERLASTEEPSTPVVIEAGGTGSAVDLALMAVAPGGTVLVLGGHEGSRISRFGLVVQKNLSVVGVNTGQDQVSAALELITRGVVTAAAVGATTVGYQDAAEALIELARGDRSDIKLVVDLRALGSTQDWDGI